MRFALRVTGIYLIAGFTWIVLTDHLLDLLDLPPSQALAAQTVKGTLFVLVSAGLIYWLLRREEAGIARARRDLDDARRRQRAIFEHALEGMLITDRDGRIIEANPEAARIYGRPREALTDLRAVDLAAKTEDGEAIRRRLLDRGTEQGEVTVTRADGSRRRIEYSARSEFVPEHTLTLVRDVTARYGAELALRESERTYRLLFDHHPNPAFVYDPVTLRLLAVNEEMVQTYGYSREELLSLTLRDLRPPEEIHHLEDVLSAGLGPLARHLARHRTKEGRTLEVEIASQAIEFQGRPARMVVVTDRTAEHQLREQLHHSQRLESLGRLAGGVAHDFNNLLTVISGFSELLDTRLEEDSTGRSQVGQIRDAAARAARLTDQLLAFGRRQVLRPKVLDLAQVAADLERMFSRLLGEQIELETRWAPDPAWVRADPGQIEQVLLNLAVNARDAMPDGGRLTLSTGHADLDEHEARKLQHGKPGRFAVVTVRDTGQGIPPDALDRIFEPFFTTKEAGKGSGLGLATAYGIAQQSGGFLSVESTLGEGSTFHLYLPRISEAQPAPSSDHRAPAELAGDEGVLVVEDQEQVRDLIVRALEHWGYRVLATADADAAREAFSRRQERTDLLITDIGLPGERGTDLARSLREEQPDLPVLFISGYAAAAGDPVQSLDRASLLQKPFNANQLVERVRELLDG